MIVQRCDEAGAKDQQEYVAHVLHAVPSLQRRTKPAGTRKLAVYAQALKAAARSASTSARTRHPLT
jgi:hypothetical protein